MRCAAVALLALVISGCFSLGRAERREQLAALMAEPEVPVVFDPAAHLAFVRVEDALTFSTGFAEGERLRERHALPSPVPGFAEAFAGALREEPRFAGTRLTVLAPGAVRETLAARGDAPVLFASAGSWRLGYDLSLARYRMSLWLHVQATSAAVVLGGRGGMALPERLWSGDCTWRGPAEAQPLEAWLAEEGSLLHRALAEAQQRCGRRVAELLVAFLERGEEQGAFDEGELPAGDSRRRGRGRPRLHAGAPQ
jgi:hypothetical protein